MTRFTEGVAGASQIVAALITPMLRGRRTTWGATPEEVRRTLPGDDLVPEPRWQYTHAVTIHAPAKAVWPWIVQMGYGRGGFYSYESLENLAGCDIRNADVILPQHQTLTIGDTIRLGPEPYPYFTVMDVRPPQSLILLGGEPEGARSSWVFHLQEVARDTTRLLERGRSTYPPTLANRLWMGPLLIEPIGFVMEREMLRGIKRRAE